MMLRTALRIATACAHGRGHVFSVRDLQEAAKCLHNAACSGSHEHVTEELLRRETAQ